MKRINDTSQIILLILLFSCILPPINRGFSDEFIIPKWYISIFTITILISWIIIKKSDIKKLCQTIPTFASFTVFLECCYALFNDDYYPIDNYSLYGTFDNPAGLSLHIILLLPFTLICFNSQKLLWKCCKVVVIIISIITIYLTKSRTGLICLGIDCIIFLYIKIQNHTKLKIFITICSFLIISTICIIQKKESSYGRYYIAQTTLNIIKESPIIGHGKDSFIKLFMRNQGKYLHNNPNCEYAVLADEIYHPLNEYLNIWLDYGIIGEMIFIIILVTPTIYFIKKKEWLITMTFINLIVFSYFSYPLFYPLTIYILIFGNIFIIHQFIKSKTHIYSNIINNKEYANTLKYCCLIICGISLGYLLYNYSYEYEWSNISRKAKQGFTREMLPRYRKIYNHFKDNPYFLYDYTLVQFQAADLSNALNTSKELHKIMSGYNLDLLTGDIYRHSNKNEKAIQFYNSAYDMCPCRFAPLEGMLLSYKADNNTDKADSIANIILNKKIKVPSSDVDEIINTAKEWLDQGKR